MMESKGVILFILSFTISLITNIILIIFSNKKELFLDKTTKEPQKFHKVPTPRVGGLGIFLAYFTTAILIDTKFTITLLVISLPFFLIGLIEDIKRNLSPITRLVWLTIGAIMTLFLLYKEIIITNIGFIELPLPIGIFLTVFALVGFANAINIIDGFNGLASGISLLILLFLSITFYEYNNFNYTLYCLSLIGSILGFFILNFPKGKIFLGDGGAYFLGFIISLFSLILINDNKELSPWFPVALSIYPTWEVLFSIIRKKWIRKISPFQPDKSHFHMLIYGRLTRKNFLTSVLILFFVFPFMLLAYFFKTDTIFLITIIVIFCIFYNSFYRSMVKFKVFKALKKS